MLNVADRCNNLSATFFSETLSGVQATVQLQYNHQKHHFPHTLHLGNWGIPHTLRVRN